MRSLAFVSLVLVASPVFAGSVAKQVINYTPGSASASFQNSSAALGLPNGDTGYGSLNPFNPAFSNTDIVSVGGGGSMTLKLDQAVGTGAGSALGVFSNVGIVDESWSPDYSSGGTGLAGSPVSTFSDPGAAYVSVSNDGTTWYTKTATGWALSTAGGAVLTTFDNPGNAYTDSTLDFGYGSIGTQSADYFKPFTGTLNDFAGKAYNDGTTDDILHLLNGSAGGNWLSLDGLPIDSVDYVKFDVPSDQRVIIDAVTAVPEPAILGLLGVGGLLMRRRR